MTASGGEEGFAKPGDQHSGCGDRTADIVDPALVVESEPPARACQCHGEYCRSPVYADLSMDLCDGPARAPFVRDPWREQVEEHETVSRVSVCAVSGHHDGQGGCCNHGLGELFADEPRLSS